LKVAVIIYEESGRFRREIIVRRCVVEHNFILRDRI
jgi:hypothetical protein